MTTKFATIQHAHMWMCHVFEPAARIVAGEKYSWVTNPRTGYADHIQVYAGRQWFHREWNKHRLHPAVESMMRIYKPDDWHRLLLEWPHKSETDPNRLAYTRDERAGEQDRQVVTSIGKYLTRHFSHAPDDMIRDIVAEHTYAGGVAITDNMDAMIDAVMRGPSSCMTKEFSIISSDGSAHHPYEVYDPSLGWSMAVRKDGDTVLGRCLLWRGDYDNDADYKCFVRSYKREKGERSHSGSDEAIESYLKARGYVKLSAWPDGTPLMRYELRRGGGYLMPYIDGGTQHVDEDTFTIDSDGDIAADETGGVSGNAYDSECEECGARFNSEDEGIWTGRHEDYRVCGNCADDYTYAYGYRGRQYYVHNNDIVEVDGEYYHDEYLGDNGIVQLHDGEYCHQDNAVWIESQNEYYHCDDDDICYDEDAGEYNLKSNCWLCEESGNWYNDGVDYVEIDGCKYHPDHAPETETQDDESGAAA